MRYTLVLFLHKSLAADLGTMPTDPFIYHISYTIFFTFRILNLMSFSGEYFPCGSLMDHKNNMYPLKIHMRSVHYFDNIVISWSNIRMDGWLDGWMAGCMNGWMCGWMCVVGWIGK